MYNDDFAVLLPHMAAMHQQQQQRSRMLGVMQSTATQPTASQTQFPPATAPRMPFQGSTGSNNTARSLFSGPAESSAPNSDSVYYPRPPVLSAELLNIHVVLLLELCSPTLR